MPKSLRVALLIESSRSYGRNLLAGIAAYARIYGPWVFYHEERSLGDPLPDTLKKWRPEGILARIENLSLLRKLRTMKVPMIDLLHEEGVPGIPCIMPDSKAITRIAIDHLRHLRLEHFAYCGLPGVVFSDNRCRHFLREFAALDYHVDVFDQRPIARTKGLAEIEKNAMRRHCNLVAWLRKLPKPVGIMACNDMRAYQVLNACREAGIRVPDEVAILGVDNDTVQCELCDPPLSSIDNNVHRIGYEAARLLDCMIDTRQNAPKMTLVEPVGVVARRSTDALAIADRDVVDIVRHVRDCACDGLTPEKLVRDTAVSRSTLERWFLKHLGHSIKAEINRVKLERIKELLIAGDLSLVEIARLTGYSHVETMQRFFKNITGQAPGQYRRTRRPAGTTVVS